MISFNGILFYNIIILLYITLYYHNLILYYHYHYFIFYNKNLFRFVAEQIQEEALVKDIIDRLNLIGDDKIGMYTFDRDIMNFRKGSSA